MSPLRDGRRDERLERGIRSSRGDLESRGETAEVLDVREDSEKTPVFFVSFSGNRASPSIGYGRGMEPRGILEIPRRQK